MFFKFVSALFIAHLPGIWSYDYIVVGSGPGGGTIATELALKRFKVLLIEAGPDYFGVNQTVPVFHARSSEDPAISFDFNVKHHDSSNRTQFYPRTGALGGCSIHNAQLAVYPNLRDFNYLQEITGDSKWSESNMRRYFKRMEGNQYKSNLKPPKFKGMDLDSITRQLNIKMNLTKIVPSLNVNNQHGTEGWYKTSYIDFLRQLKLDDKLTNILIAVAGNPSLDLNGYDKYGKLNTDQIGRVFIPQSVETDKYSRVNFPNYIKKIAEQGYLTIMTNSFVTKVLINKHNKAYGVEYHHGEYLYQASPLSNKFNRMKSRKSTILAKKEIIVSGGAFNTPQLLMLSGIGDKDQLESLEIPLRQHLPGVGKNMMDRYEVPIVTEFKEDFELLKPCLFIPSFEDPCYKEYIENQSGPYTSNGVLSGELIKSSLNLTEPDLFVLNTISDFHGYFRGYANNLVKHKNAFTRLILKAHSNNDRGEVKLQSNDPFQVPSVNFHSFSDDGDDLDILVRAIQKERFYLKTSLDVPHREVIPGAKVRSESDIRNFVMENAWGHHACCTAKMGTDNDPTAVLDNKFQVRGIQNLRVVDASAIPKIPGYFPTLYLHLMAMKAADDIAPDRTFRFKNY